ncbi:helix-turn-helix transcriptional regulator [Acidovorax cavernicola]|uniref:AraC family transcriptional regulator n=1 Tax=Acidovorax cavernicola TaxID=1675792 RepID=A0A9X8D343_9BURK|nr:AraC family transcriptional regulator [Acidovorax cavernicola]RIX77726.1 AraC family transcriptional regulator [Acidovorax cavernicola]
MNQRCDATTPVTAVVANTPRLRIVKRVEGDLGTYEFRFALTGLAVSSETITVANGVAVSGATITGTSGQAVTITEYAPPGWPRRPVSASCTTPSVVGVIGTLNGNVLTIPANRMVPGSELVCTFVNNPAFALNGRVFNDNGVGGGVANDGVINGAEKGLANVVVQVGGCGAPPLDSVVTDGNGRYSLNVPYAWAGALCLEKRGLVGFMPAGVSVGGVQLRTDRTTVIDSKTYGYSRLNPPNRVTFTWDGRRMASMEATNSWMIGLPRVLVDRWLPDAADATETCFKGDKGWAQVLSAYLCATSPEHLRHISSPVERGFAVEHVMSMLSFAFAQNGFEKMAGDAESRVSPRDRELHVRMRRWIADNFSNPDVSAQSLATDFNISTRYVHKVFANVQRGVTFWGVVQDARLKNAARLLRTPLYRHGSIEDVALRCGFVDTAYFSLVFRKRFGCTPRAFALKTEDETPKD